MGTHPIFESDFDCLTDSEREQHRRDTVKMAKRKVEEIALNDTRENEDMLIAQRNEVIHVTGIEEVMGNGISKNDINNLKEAGFYTVQALSMATRKDLEKIQGISEN